MEQSLAHSKCSVGTSNHQQFSKSLSEAQRGHTPLVTQIQNLQGQKDKIQALKESPVESRRAVALTDSTLTTALVFPPAVTGGEAPGEELAGRGRPVGANSMHSNARLTRTVMRHSV